MPARLRFLFPCRARAAITSSAGAQQTNPAVETTRMLWQQMTGYVTQAAEDVPESLYGYRPTALVRSFGELIGHVAGAQNLICAAALGEPARSEDEIERSQTTKAGLIAAARRPPSTAAGRMPRPMRRLSSAPSFSGRSGPGCLP